MINLVSVHSSCVSTDCCCWHSAACLTPIVLTGLRYGERLRCSASCMRKARWLCALCRACCCQRGTRRLCRMLTRIWAVLLLLLPHCVRLVGSPCLWQCTCAHCRLPSLRRRHQGSIPHVLRLASFSCQTLSLGLRADSCCNCPRRLWQVVQERCDCSVTRLAEVCRNRAEVHAFAQLLLQLREHQHELLRHDSIAALQCCSNALDFAQCLRSLLCHGRSFSISLCSVTFSVWHNDIAGQQL